MFNLYLYILIPIRKDNRWLVVYILLSWATTNSIKPTQKKNMIDHVMWNENQRLADSWLPAILEFGLGLVGWMGRHNPRSCPLPFLQPTPEIIPLIFGLLGQLLPLQMTAGCALTCRGHEQCCSLLCSVKLYIGDRHDEWHNEHCSRMHV